MSQMQRGRVATSVITYNRMMSTSCAHLLLGLSLFSAQFVGHDALPRHLQVRLVEQLSKNVTVANGDRLSLLCHPDHQPTSGSSDVVSWYKDDKPLQPSTSWRIRTQAQRVHFKPAKLEDSGFYGCLVDDRLGWRNVTLIVAEPGLNNDDHHGFHDEYNHQINALSAKSTRNSRFPAEEAEFRSNYAMQASATTRPRFKEELARSDLTPRAGGTLELECPATGHPQPNVIWLKDGGELQSNNQRLVTNSWTLKLRELVVQDSGNYICVVCNALGCINHTFKVNVAENAQARSIILTPTPANTTVPIGSNANFICVVLGETHRELKWYHGDRTFRNTLNMIGSDISWVEVKTEGDESYPEILEIHNVTEKDEGWYTCIAQSSMGYTFSSTYLRVVANHLEKQNNLLEPEIRMLFSLLLVMCIIPTAVILFAVLHSLMLQVEARWKETR